ncbi:MAG: transposase [Deltaproteobacteria bacterium]|nr:transposase [Deltaproteobacteria bacterium]
MTTTGMPRHRLTDAQWELIGDLFPTNNFETGRRPRDRRLMLDAIFWVLRTGAPWRDLPECLAHGRPPGTSSTSGRRTRRSTAYFGDCGASPSARRGPSELWCIDGTSIRAARCSSGGGKDPIRRSQRITLWALPRGWGTKIQIL